MEGLPIWDFFIYSISSPNGETYVSAGGYGKGLSVIRIPVPPEARGKFLIEIKDQSDNSAQFQGAILPKQ